MASSLKAFYQRIPLVSHVGAWEASLGYLIHKFENVSIAAFWLIISKNI